MVKKKALPKKPLFSIVILTCNRKEMLLDLLEDLYRQTLISETQIIVVDNDSHDGTCDSEKVNFLADEVIHLDENIGCAGRNEGIKQMHGASVRNKNAP